MSGKDAFCSSTILEMSFSVIFLIMMFAIVVSGELITCYQPILIIRKECLNLDLNPKAIIADSWGKQFNSSHSNQPSIQLKAEILYP